MTQRIAPNNQLPATHFIEVWKGGTQKIHNASMEEIKYLPLEMEGGEVVITRNAVSDDEKREFEGAIDTATLVPCKNSTQYKQKLEEIYNYKNRSKLYFRD